jgi:hypothetical protein
MGETCENVENYAASWEEAGDEIQDVIDRKGNENCDVKSGKGHENYCDVRSGSGDKNHDARAEYRQITRPRPK